MADFGEQLWESYIYCRRSRTRATASVGAIAFFAGIALAGQIMIFLGCFELGKTSTIKILDYWPGFLAGGLLLGVPAAFAARSWMKLSPLQLDRIFDRDASWRGSGNNIVRARILAILWHQLVIRSRDMANSRSFAPSLMSALDCGVC